MGTEGQQRFSFPRQPRKKPTRRSGLRGRESDSAKPLLASLSSKFRFAVLPPLLNYPVPLILRLGTEPKRII